MLNQRKVPFLGSLAVATMIAGCITVHVYFPAKELREAADEIVDEVRPDIASAEDSGAESEAGNRTDNSLGDAGDVHRQGRDTAGSGQHIRVPPTRPTLLSASFARIAWADEKDSTEKPDEVINASSPKIKKIKASLKARYKKLLPLYTARRIGEGQDGHLVVREVKDLKLKERRKVNTLVKAENADR